MSKQTPSAWAAARVSICMLLIFLLLPRQKIIYLGQSSFSTSKSSTIIDHLIILPQTEYSFHCDSSKCRQPFSLTNETAHNACQSQYSHVLVQCFSKLKKGACQPFLVVIKLNEKHRDTCLAGCWSLNTKCFLLLKVSFSFSSLEEQADVWQLLLWMWCISGFCSLWLNSPVVQKARSLDHNVLSHSELLVQYVPTGKSNRAYEQAKARLPGC